MIIKKIEYINVLDEMPDNYFPIDLVFYIKEDNIDHVIVALLERIEDESDGISVSFHSLYSYVRFTGDIKRIHEDEDIKEKMRKISRDDSLNYDYVYEVEDVLELAKSGEPGLQNFFKLMLYLLSASEDDAEILIKEVIDKDLEEIVVPEINLKAFATSSVNID